MSGDSQSVHDDLAFMRSVVEAGNSRTAMAGGFIFFAGGLIYGLQCLVQWLGLIGILPLSQTGWLVTGLGPTAIFLIVLGWFVWRTRGMIQPRVQRAINAAFAAAGTTNVAILIVVGTLAARKDSGEIWELYPCVVFALQGAAWLVAFMLRRRTWLLAVALGWFASAILLGFLIGTTTFVLVAALALLGLMALPGLVMMRLAQRAE